MAKAVVLSLGKDIYKTNRNFEYLAARMAKKNTDQFRKEVEELGGVRPFRLGQLFVQKINDKYEQYELQVKQIWEKSTLDGILEKKVNVELLLSRLE